MANLEKSEASSAAGKENLIYTRRFSNQEDSVRRETWKVLCEDFFETYLKETDIVVDVGAGDGNFSRNIKARRRIAVDLSPHVNALSAEGIEVLQIPADQLSIHLSEKVDIVFMSNFLEHLPDKGTLLRVLEEARAVLKPGGRILILQPNIRFVGSAYWDYIDHHIALTEKSLVEALEVVGFQIERVIPKFLPYSVKSRLGSFLSQENVQSFLRFYLGTPILWRIFGKQTFVVAQRPH